VTDVAVLMEYCRAIASTAGAIGKPQLNSELCSYNFSQSNKCYAVLAIWRFFVSKFVDIGPGLLELSKNVIGVRFC